MKIIHNIKQGIPFKDGENYTQSKRDEKGEIIKNEKGEPEKEDITLHDLMIRAIYEYFPQAATMQTLKIISRISRKLDKAQDDVGFGDEDYPVLLEAMAQLTQFVPAENRPALFRPVLVGRAIELIEDEADSSNR